MDNIHENHCDNCFYTFCSYSDCPHVKCNFCHIPLHSCKLDEHVELVCRRATVPCLNSSYGCKQLMIREKVASHLPKCVASVVVCSRDRCRKLNIKSCKLSLKHMGRRNQLLSTEHPDFDVQLTLHDQNLIITSYNSSRPRRVRQRDPLHLDHPLIPLRNSPFDTSPPTADDVEDSSEDERQEKREKAKKSRMVFANCYMCQIDPSVQHLHTLGNGMDIEKLKKRRMTTQVLDPFHESLNLKVSVNVETVSELVLKSENIREIKKGGSFYTIKCLKTVKRLEFGDHHLSQHTLSIDQLNEMIVRCPNWSRGCKFSASRIKSATGEIRFHPLTSTMTHNLDTDSEESFNSTGKTSENQPLWVYERLCEYLPTSALYNLSLTSKKLREVVFVGCQSLCYVEPVWKKTSVDGHWYQDGFITKISSTESPPKLKWDVPVELSKHIPLCKHFDAVEYEEKMVPVFPRNLESEIWKEFANELSERMIRAELVDMQEDPE